MAFRDANLRMSMRATEQMIERIAPALAQVLAEGKAAGDFDIDDPLETAHLVCVVRWLYPENANKPFSLAEVSLEQTAVSWRDYAPGLPSSYPCCWFGRETILSTPVDTSPPERLVAPRPK